MCGQQFYLKDLRSRIKISVLRTAIWIKGCHCQFRQWAGKYSCRWTETSFWQICVENYPLAPILINNEKLSSVLEAKIYWHRHLSITVGGKKQLGLFITIDYYVLPITIEGKSRSNMCVCTSIPVSNTDTYIAPNTPDNTFRPRAQLS